jgi:hypothetical protein
MDDIKMLSDPPDRRSGLFVFPFRREQLKKLVDGLLQALDWIGV